MSGGRLRPVWGVGPEEDEDEDGHESRHESRHEYKNYAPPEMWKDKTIRSAVRIRAEGGRTYSEYLCVVFTDYSRALLCLTGNGTPFDPVPSLDEMRKAADFFTPADIADRVFHIERKKRTKQAEQKRSKLLQIERLQKELARIEKS